MEAKARDRAQRTFQREAYITVMVARRPVAEDRMRDRLKRWNLPGLPLRLARGALRRLAVLQGAAPPRLGSAALSTLWNRWCTARRFQGRSQCVLGCQGQDDEIEHYAHYIVVHNFAATFVGLRFPRSEGLAIFTLTHSLLDDHAMLIRAAVVIYAVWRVTERNRGGALGVEAGCCRDMLEQMAREGVRGHPATSRLLDGPR